MTNNNNQYQPNDPQKPVSQRSEQLVAVQRQPTPAKTNVMAIIALIISIASIITGLLGWFFINIIVVLIGVILGVAGIVFGASGIAKGVKSGCGKEIANAGFVCGIIGTVFALALLPFVSVLQKVEKVTDIGGTIVDTIIDIFT